MTLKPSHFHFSPFDINMCIEPCQVSERKWCALNVFLRTCSFSYLSSFFFLFLLLQATQQQLNFEGSKKEREKEKKDFAINFLLTSFFSLVLCSHVRFDHICAKFWTLIISD